jgi:hypothetical protein
VRANDEERKRKRRLYRRHLKRERNTMKKSETQKARGTTTVYEMDERINNSSQLLSELSFRAPPGSSATPFFRLCKRSIDAILSLHSFIFSLVACFNWVFSFSLSRRDGNVKLRVA